MSTKAITKKRGIFNRFLDAVEFVGNKLPHPVTLFVMLALIVVIISDIAARAGVAEEFERITNGVPENVRIEAVSLLTVAGIRRIFSEAVSNFTGFPPLGTVLVAMLGVGVAEGTGLIQASLRKLVLVTPKRFITLVVVFAGIMSNVASDAGYVVLVPLGALVFLSFKRHPLAGLAAAFAGVSGGFSANLIIGTLDPLLGGITMSAANMYSPGYIVDPTANWYFMIASTFVIMIIGTFVTEKIVEPRLGAYNGDETVEIERISNKESKGLIWALISLVAFVAVIAFLVVPANGILRDDAGKILGTTPFMSGLVPIIALSFLIPGIAFGIAAGTVKSDKDVANHMGKAMSTMGGYLVLAFVMAQFVSYFSWTNLGTILAVRGADVLRASGLTGIGMLIGFILVSGFINLFIGSASAKWAIMAPIFVPMLMDLGYTPEFTQLAYRIGDSTTNIITPLMAYFAVIVAFAQKYDKKTGIGTLISMMVPYSLLFMIGWVLLFVLWFMVGLPIGPGVFVRF
ncbi:AbgT family transporter [Serpentinicella alkaliphila]|uniref:Aminobenzoyl-glutamate transport protein n=1 Tax=Serpentinicella alkaliphila TaxID=1734049 RepID=A0A4R2TKM4_9FIRM|nr:AbgT family transporter [Serpentinicella alkaliphila]QUH25090.1 AbgT family transporter [Serpentinicella alkaliphila]TCQ01735.1 aminobenzoyl-glutamate transport protein [Serpentinicella alkaliphila]